MCHDPPLRNSNNFIFTFLLIYLHIFTEHDNVWHRPINSKFCRSSVRSFSISATSERVAQTTRVRLNVSHAPLSVTVHRAARDMSLTLMFIVCLISFLFRSWIATVWIPSCCPASNVKGLKDILFVMFRKYFADCSLSD